MPEKYDYKDVEFLTFKNIETKEKQIVKILMTKKK